MISQSENPKYKIALYVRNSDIKQDTLEGTVKNQEQRLREFVKLKNLSGDFGKVVGVYIDRSLSAKDMQRPALQRLMADVREGKVNLILASELSRISRNMMDFLSFWDLLKEYKCGFSSLRENVDTSNAAGEMVLRTIVNIAQFEREQTRERVLANTVARAKRGLYNGGTVPLGYRLVKDKPGYLDINPEEAEVVRTAFDAFLKFESLNATAKWLNKNNFRPNKIVRGGGQCVRQGQFHCSNLQRLLRNKTYIGLKRYKEGDVWKTAPALWKAVVEEEKFNRVQALMTENYEKKRKPFTDTRWPYTLSGLAYCIKCKSVMCGKSAHGRKRKYGYYEHSWASKRGSALVKGALKCDPHRVPAEKLEAAVNCIVEKLLYNESFARGIIEEAHKAQGDDPSQKELVRLKKLVTGLGGHEKALVARVAELPPNVSAAAFYKQLEEVQTAKEKAEASILELEQGRCMVNKTPAAFKDYRSFLGLARKTFEQESGAEERSKLFKRLIHRIEIGTDRVRVHLYASDDVIRGSLGGEKSPPRLPFVVWGEKKFKNSGSTILTVGARRGT